MSSILKHHVLGPLELEAAAYVFGRKRTFVRFEGGCEVEIIQEDCSFEINLESVYVPDDLHDVPGGTFLTLSEKPIESERITFKPTALIGLPVWAVNGLPRMGTRHVLFRHGDSFRRLTGFNSGLEDEIQQLIKDMETIPQQNKAAIDAQMILISSRISSSPLENQLFLAEKQLYNHLFMLMDVSHHLATEIFDGRQCLLYVVPTIDNGYTMAAFIFGDLELSDNSRPLLLPSPIEDAPPKAVLVAPAAQKVEPNSILQEIVCATKGKTYKPEETWISENKFTKKCTPDGSVIILNCLINDQTTINVNSELKLGKNTYKCYRNENEGRVYLEITENETVKTL